MKHMGYSVRAAGLLAPCTWGLLVPLLTSWGASDGHVASSEIEMGTKVGAGGSFWPQGGESRSAKVVLRMVFFLLTAAMTRERRRHQPRRPPPAKIKPGSPAPAIGAGTLAIPGSI